MQVVVPGKNGTKGLAMIDNQAAVALFGSLTDLLRTARAVGQRNGGAGATGTALGVLKTLSLGDARPGDLAQGLRVVPSVITRAIAPLEQDGLVERKPDPADARATLLGLTDLGRERLRSVQQVYVHQLQQSFDSWTSDEAEQAAAVLGRLKHSLADYQQPEMHRRQIADALQTTTTPDDPERDALETEQVHA